MNPSSTFSRPYKIGVIGFDLKVVDEYAVGMVLMRRRLYGALCARSRDDLRADAELAEGNHSLPLDIERMLGRCRDALHDLTARVRKGHRDRLVRQMLMQAHGFFVIQDGVHLSAGRLRQTAP